MSSRTAIAAMLAVAAAPIGPAGAQQVFRIPPQSVSQPAAESLTRALDACASGDEILPLALDEPGQTQRYVRLLRENGEVYATEEVTGPEARRLGECMTRAGEGGASGTRSPLVG
jgi:hypothetical protein